MTNLRWAAVFMGFAGVVWIIWAALPGNEPWLARAVMAGIGCGHYFPARALWDGGKK